MKMRPGTQTGFLLCGKEWSEGEAIEVRSPWDQGLIGKVTLATRADAREGEEPLRDVRFELPGGEVDRHAV